MAGGRILLLAALTTAVWLMAGPARPVAGQQGQDGPVTQNFSTPREVGGVVARVPKLATPPPEPAAVRTLDEDEQVNPAEPPGAAVDAPPPSVPPTVVADEPDPTGDRPEPGIQGPALVLPGLDEFQPGGGGVSPDGGGGLNPEGGIQVAAASDFVIFRNQTVKENSYASGDSTVREPSTHNDRNLILQTGNWYGAFSADNGQTWEYLDPDDFPEPLDPDGDAMDFCCDQVVVSKADSTHELIFWLLQYDHEDAAENAFSNVIRIAVARGKDDFESSDPQAEFCLYDFSAPDDFDGTEPQWFDFNYMATTDKWLYVASNLYSGTSEGRIGAVVWRMELDDFAGCGSVTSQYATLSDDYYSPALTLGSGSTMYWAVHWGSSNDELRISEVADASNTITHTTKSITAYPSSDRGDFTCTTPDGSNPCRRHNDRIIGAWRGGGVVGWMWNAAQDGDDYAYPFVRVARFNSSSLSRIDEPNIWNADYAWTAPSVGVNEEGDIAGVVYVMGGAYHPRAYAFIFDDVSGTPAPWEVHTLRYGDTSPDDSGWGDYGGTTYYDNCRGTWVAGYYTLQVSGGSTVIEHRNAWFGRERDGCADLVVNSVAMLPTSVETGDLLIYGGVTANIGSATAGASVTRFYLSTDQELSSGDFELTDADSISSLSRGDTDNLISGETIPSGLRSGAYYLIGCADADDDASEVTNTNNCTAGDQVLEVARTLVLTLFTTPLIPGFNLLAVGEGTTAQRIIEAISEWGRAPLAVFLLGAEGFRQYRPGQPAFLNTLAADEPIPADQALWVLMDTAGRWTRPLPREPLDTQVRPGFNLLTWRGAALPLVEASRLLGGAVYLYTPAGFRSFDAQRPAFLNDADLLLRPGDAFFLRVDADAAMPVRLPGRTPDEDPFPRPPVGSIAEMELR